MSDVCEDGWHPAAFASSSFPAPRAAPRGRTRRDLLAWYDATMVSIGDKLLISDFLNSAGTLSLQQLGLQLLSLSSTLRQDGAIDDPTCKNLQTYAKSMYTNDPDGFRAAADELVNFL